jgi:hypothetical protein
MDPIALPGEELVAIGLGDLARGVVSEEALLVSLAAPRLAALGVEVPNPLPDAEIRLYRLLAERHGDAAHARYNGLVRRMVSYQRAVACAK